MMTKKGLAALLAALTGLALASCVDIDTGPPDMQTMRESRPVSGTKELAVRLNYDVGAFEVRSLKGDDLFSFNLDYDARRSSPRFDFDDGEHARMNLSMNSRGGLHGG